jgi:hypothetical protein
MHILQTIITELPLNICANRAKTKKLPAEALRSPDLLEELAAATDSRFREKTGLSESANSVFPVLTGFHRLGLPAEAGAVLRLAVGSTDFSTAMCLFRCEMVAFMIFFSSKSGGECFPVCECSAYLR